MKQRIFVLVLIVHVFTTNVFSQEPSPPLINQSELEHNMEMLSVGLAAVSNIPQVREALYAGLNLCVSDYYYMFYSDLISVLSDNHQIEIKAEMNNAIREYYRLNGTTDYIAGVFEWCKLNHNMKPQIVIMDYSKFQMMEDILEMQPNVGWFTFERAWPLTCLNCETGSIYQDQVMHAITWFVTPAPSALYFSGNNGFFIQINNCAASIWDGNGTDPNCQVCHLPATTPVTEEYLGSCGSANHELKITTAEWDESGSPSPYYCVNIQPASFPVNGIIPSSTAILRKLNTYDYYRVQNDSINNKLVKKVIKVPYPLVDYKHIITGTNTYLPMWGDGLSLCEEGIGTQFESMSSNNWQATLHQFRYSNAWGVYDLYRPGIAGMDHLYFAYPWSEGLWFQSSPDMTIKMILQATSDDRPNCPHNDWQNNEAFYDLCGDQFYQYTNDVFNPLYGNGMNCLISTDYNKITSYWGDNAITVGLKSGGNSAAGNVYEFTAGFNPPAGCTLPGNTQQLQQFIVNASGEYEVTKEVRLNGNQVPVGTPLYLNVQANFTNGEYINETKCIAVNNTDIEQAVIQFRGNIKNYDAAVTNNNYRVTIYY